jgi:hypothetical protein
MRGLSVALTITKNLLRGIKMKLLLPRSLQQCGLKNGTDYVGQIRLKKYGCTGNILNEK